MLLIIDISVLRQDLIHTIEISRLEPRTKGRDTYTYKVVVLPGMASQIDLAPPLPWKVGTIEHDYSSGALALTKKALDLIGQALATGEDQ